MTLGPARIEHRVTTGNILAIIVSVVSILGATYAGLNKLTSIGGEWQRITDSIDALHTQLMAVELAQSRLENATAGTIADIRSDQLRNQQAQTAQLKENDAKRDANEEQMRAAMDRMTDRLNALTDHLISRDPVQGHSELTIPLPSMEARLLPPRGSAP